MQYKKGTPRCYVHPLKKCDTQIADLLNDDKYHIEFNGHLTNHNKHAVIALHGLGASVEHIKAYYTNYAALTPYKHPLEPPKKSQHVITTDNWQQYLGKRTSFSAYFDFYSQQHKALGMEQLLRKYVPLLLPGWAAALTHGAIHLGWALDIKNEYMIIEGLAYMSYTFRSCYPERIDMSFIELNNPTINTLPLESFLYIAEQWQQHHSIYNTKIEAVITDKSKDESLGIHPELTRSGLQYRIAKVFIHGHPLIYQLPGWVIESDMQSIWEQLYYLATLLFMTEPGDFLILHFITSLYAMKTIALQMPSTMQRDFIKNYWVGSLCILFSSLLSR